MLPTAPDLLFKQISLISPGHERPYLPYKMAEGTQMIDPALLDLDQLPATALAGVISPSNMAKINDNDNDAATRYDRLQHISKQNSMQFDIPRVDLV